MHDDMQPPVNPLPPVVWALFAAIMGVEAVLSLGNAGYIGGPGAVGWRLMALRDYGFSGVAFDWMVANAIFPWEHLLRFVTYPFVNNGFSGTLFAGVILLALGKLVGEVMGQLAVAVVFFFSAIFGAVVYGLLTDAPWLIGAFPAVYGLIGAYTFLMWQKLAGTGPQQLQAFSLIGVLMGLQLLFGIFFEVGLDWIAELAGFFCGFALSLVVVPGGWTRLRGMIQRR
ncbi:rhomboid family intramembrane serine protease [Pseudosulfitobacter koreensis]|uniref:Rhomboid family intramembrane serine protease n=1 Tax=Pseudosulfitobacter koreensis TaxID=2968472 RepID=A0ABT1Z3M6_9RHOB|nr:rhomboid family intramembrane serine protease [Pseudosulfitobacter koreense]MCR8827731.1 rhomboid family intramembrane serine protease [Pseudosulfitobacter koreense]